MLAKMTLPGPSRVLKLGVKLTYCQTAFSFYSWDTQNALHRAFCDQPNMLIEMFTNVNQSWENRKENH